MAKIGTMISNWLFSKKIGSDQFGNQYYLSRFKNASGHNKRIVIYKGLNEPSKVPPKWHAWLHYMVDDAPSNDLTYEWQKEHLPNLTGTKFSHKPDGMSGGKKKIGSDYQAWEAN